MRSERHGQADLFQERAAVADLIPEVRAKLTPLLQVLLAEAAGLGRAEATPETVRQESGDDQDHA